MANRLWEIEHVTDLEDPRVDETVRFLNDHFRQAYGRDLSTGFLRWKLGHGSPAGQGLLTVCIYENRVIGTLTAIPRILRVHGRDIPAFELGDGVSHPQFRQNCRAKVVHHSNDDPSAYVNTSIFGRLGAEMTERMRASGCEFIYGTPNSLARPGWTTRSGYVEYPHHKTRSTHVALGNRVKSVPLARRAMYSVGWLPSHAANAYLMRRNRSMGLKVVPRMPSGTDLDHLWTTAEAQTRSRLQPRRDGTCLTYRYGDVPDCRYNWFTVALRDSVVGAIVTRVIDRPNGIRTMAVADWLFEDARHELLPPSLAAVMSQIESPVVETMSLWINQDASVARRLRVLGFPPGRRQSVIAFPTDLVRTLVAQGVGFDVTLGTTDNI